MAKSSKSAAPKATPTPAASNEAAPEKKSSKKMSKADAQAVVDRYAGINGNNSIDELNEAKAVLKGE